MSCGHPAPACFPSFPPWPGRRWGESTLPVRVSGTGESWDSGSPAYTAASSRVISPIFSQEFGFVSGQLPFSLGRLTLPPARPVPICTERAVSLLPASPRFSPLPPVWRPHAGQSEARELCHSTQPSPRPAGWWPGKRRRRGMRRQAQGARLSERGDQGHTQFPDSQARVSTLATHWDPQKSC